MSSSGCPHRKLDFACRQIRPVRPLGSDISMLEQYAVVGIAVGGAGWYLTRLARGPDGAFDVPELTSNSNLT